MSHQNSPAMLFAIEAHGDQKYGGDRPYREHLFHVVQVLRDFGYSGKWLDAGALHDTIEDTSVTREQIGSLFGLWVENVVWAVSGFGPNRKARNADIYAKIAVFYDAAIVKMADRIANVEASPPGGSHIGMYLKEREQFHEAVGCHTPPEMQARLERAYEAGRRG